MKFEAERIFDHPRDAVFNVLADAERYRVFVPLCRESEILERKVTPQGESMKTRSRFRSRRFGVDIETVLLVEIDRGSHRITARPAPEDESGHDGVGWAELEALGPGRTRMVFTSRSRRRGVWDMLTLKNAVARMIIKKFFDVVDERVTHLQAGRLQPAKGTESDEAAQTDPRDTLLARLPRGGTGAELGVYVGAFAERLLEAVQPRKLHLVDPWARLDGESYEDSWYVTHDQEHMDDLHDLVRERFSRQVGQGQVEIHRCTATAFLAQQPDDSLDWVYIDGDHSYEAVCADLAASFPKITPGGLISGDDYRQGGWFKDNVIRAVDEFVSDYPVEMTFNHHGQYILVKQEG
ncbi:MAG: class I SAM-dependent methyltransferase [Pseudomonadota bacterium]